MTEPSHNLNVEGMSCDHCVQAVQSEVGAVDGVTAVVVDLDAGTVAVDGGDRDAVIEAIDEAGFAVV